MLTYPRSDAMAVRANKITLCDLSTYDRERIAAQPTYCPPLQFRIAMIEVHHVRRIRYAAVGARGIFEPHHGLSRHAAASLYERAMLLAVPRIVATHVDAMARALSSEPLRSQPRLIAILNHEAPGARPSRTDP